MSKKTGELCARMTQRDNLSQAQRERLFHIDFRLYFPGSVYRAGILARFGLKEAAASFQYSVLSPAPFTTSK